MTGSSGDETGALRPLRRHEQVVRCGVLHLFGRPAVVAGHQLGRRCHRHVPAVPAKPVADVFAFLEVPQLVVAGDLPSPAASRKTCANGSRINGFSLRVSAARDDATPSAVAPTLSVISQLSSSLLGTSTARVSVARKGRDGGRTGVNGHRERPAPNDGGAEDSAVPQSRLGMVASENVRSPPVLMIESDTNV